MPLVSVTFSTPASETDQRARVARLMTRLAARVLKKREDLTAVIVEQVDASGWTIAGRSLATLGLASYAVEIKVTEGTNTAAEKASFLAEVHAGMGEILGALHPESYVHVLEARGDAYGYGGLTQAFRADEAAIERKRRDDLATAAIARYGVR
ncbi:tautomerase family protein [Chthonobacter albigriseus]|uniref:tautomerase family protein n=1 Tax=Chthonobacter albigriseus TaxID=1683161 RepID=UPI0015EF454A|nr:tautomerase family protein [Chthonobacter albigriseus]